MKASMLLVGWAAALAAPALATQVALRGGLQDRKITEVVKILQTQLEAAKAEGDTERKLFAKYKCYCDTNQATKNDEVARLTEDIAVLGAKIEELSAANGKLSGEVAKLDADITQNKADQEEATAIRTKEKTEFLAKETDLVNAIDQMKAAFKVLAEVGADQTMGTDRGHEQYMAGVPSLLKLKVSVKTALVAASAFVSQKQAERLDSFLQEPFTGTYSARSGEVVGILKDMMDTFEANLASAREVEARAQAAHDAFMFEMGNALANMQRSYNTKQGLLAGNDADLSSKRSQLEAALKQLADAQGFLAKLLEMCSAKSKQYDERVALRASEEAALSEAIAILNSDAAFATFGDVAATSFVQRKSTIRRHRQQPEAATAEQRKRAGAFLQAAAKVKGSSPLIGRIFAMLQANNPFATVLEEIEKMLAIIKKEGEADTEQKAWCDTEREETNAGIKETSDKIISLEGAIGELDTTINDPATGLIVQIKNAEDSLRANNEDQVSSTADRKEESKAYEKDIATLVEAEELISRAVVVLKAYYSKIVAANLVQVTKADPAPPATWQDKYVGQSAGSNGAISMLEFILTNTKKEETQAHVDEVSAQHSYEDAMAELKTTEASLQEGLVSLNLALTEASKDLQLKREDLEKTQAEKAALEAYLEKIKPGCDFITANIGDRTNSRAKETESLTSATAMLKKTPAYQKAMAAQHEENLGRCKEICGASEDHVDCKACLADVSVHGYCAGHPATHGCEGAL